MHTKCGQRQKRTKVNWQFYKGNSYEPFMVPPKNNQTSEYEIRYNKLLKTCWEKKTLYKHLKVGK